MTRMKRMKRVADVAKTAERLAHQRVAASSNELHDAEQSLEEIFVGCRQVADSSDDLSIRFGRTLIESGWLAAQEQEARCFNAAAELAERSEEWRGRRSRVDALGRLLDRLQAADSKEQERLRISELEDVIASRVSEPLLVALASGGQR